MAKEIIKRTKPEIAKMPEGLEGPGFFAAWLVKIRYGLYHSQHLAAVLSSWQPWLLITI